MQQWLNYLTTIAVYLPTMQRNHRSRKHIRSDVQPIKFVFTLNLSPRMSYDKGRHYLEL